MSIESHLFEDQRPENSHVICLARCTLVLANNCLLMQAKLLEHNVRFGDPECQCMMMRLETDLLQVLLSAASGQLHTVELKWAPDASLCVVMAAEGYPGPYKKGTPINGLEAVKNAKVQ